MTLFYKKNTPPPTENSGSSTSSGGSSNYGTLGRGAGGSMASMMDEMAKTLARRRAAVRKLFYITFFCVVGSLKVSCQP